MDKVSVVITTYERNSTLERAIKSVLDQTYPNIEVIIVDDNKEISYRKEVEQIIERVNSPHIILVQNKKNMGGALARNEGIKKSTGKYIGFLDDDDEYCPKKIEEQVKLFEKDETGKLALVYCYCRGISAKREFVYRYDYTGNCVFEGMYECIAATSQWLCSKQALLAVGGFNDTPCKQDSTVIVKLLVAGYSVDRVPKILSIYHDEDLQRISSGNHNMKITGEENLRRLCRENYALITRKQQQEVEYSFACRLVFHYLAIRDKKKYRKALALVVLRHSFKKSSLIAYRNIFRVMLKQ